MKYDNRRLYDPEACRYITEKDIRALVMQGAHVCIREHRTEADLSRSVLLRVLAAESGEEPVLTVEVLSDLIRCTDPARRREINVEFAKVLRHLMPRSSDRRPAG